MKNIFNYMAGYRRGMPTSFTDKDYLEGNRQRMLENADPLTFAKNFWVMIALFIVAAGLLFLFEGARMALNGLSAAWGAFLYPLSAVYPYLVPVLAAVAGYRAGLRTGAHEHRCRTGGSRALLGAEPSMVGAAILLIVLAHAGFMGAIGVTQNPDTVEIHPENVFLQYALHLGALCLVGSQPWMMRAAAGLPVHRILVMTVFRVAVLACLWFVAMSLETGTTLLTLAILALASAFEPAFHLGLHRGGLRVKSGAHVAILALWASYCVALWSAFTTMTIIPLG